MSATIQKKKKKKCHLYRSRRQNLQRPDQCKGLACWEHRMENHARAALINSSGKGLLFEAPLPRGGRFTLSAAVFKGVTKVPIFTQC